jgi:hypothetical protein
MSDWTTDAADAIDRTVALIRERTVEPTRAITRVVVYGFLAAIIIVPAVVMAMIALFRIVVEIEQNYVWAAWFTFSGIFLIAGALCWTRRNT